MSVVVDYHTLKTDPIIQSFLSRNRHIIETLAVDCTERSDYLKAYEQLGIESVSTTMLIAPNGSIVWETRWIADAKVFVDKIDAVINGRNKP